MRILGDKLARKAKLGMLRASAEPIYWEMVRTCPVGPTGNLANSIKVTMHGRNDPSGQHVKVGPRAPHAHLIHLGHDVRVPRLGYGGQLKYWGKYWAQKMHGKYIPGKRAKPNPFVTVAGDRMADAAVDAAADHLHEVLRKFEDEMLGQWT